MKIERLTFKLMTGESLIFLDLSVTLPLETGAMIAAVSETYDSLSSGAYSGVGIFG